MMRKLAIAIALGSVLTAAPLSAAMSQSAKSEYTVFIDRSGNKPLTIAAKDTIHKAVKASRSHVIDVSGRADHVAVVKDELLRQGVPADRINVQPAVAKPLLKAGDSIGNLTDRQVVISF